MREQTAFVYRLRQIVRSRTKTRRNKAYLNVLDATTIKKAKAELRNTIKSRIAAVPVQQLITAGSCAALLLPSIPGWERFRSVLLFSSMKDEIDTSPLIETIINAKKTVFIPQIEGEDMVFYQAGHTCPGDGKNALALKPADFPALVITPGLAFDRNMIRLGRGRSFYDRFFTSLDAAHRDYTALGLCMDCQLADKIPADIWDKKMDMLLTESGLILPF